MAQRVSLIHPNLVDPRTGGALQAIGTVAGRAVWPILGGSEGSTEGGSGGQSGEGQQNNNDGGEGGAGQQGDGTDAGQNKDGDGTEGQQNTEGQTVSKADFDRLMLRMQAADRRAGKAENDLKARQDQDLTEGERLKQERDEALAASKSLQEEIKNSRIANAFLSNSDINWHNPGDALKMLMSDFMDGVEVAEDGKVTGMKEAIKALAKDKEYLIKPKETSGASAEDQMNGRRKGEGGDQKAADAALRKRMPHLSRGSF